MELQIREERAQSISVVEDFSLKLYSTPGADAVLSPVLQHEVHRKRMDFGRAWKDFYEDSDKVSRSPVEAKLIMESQELHKALVPELQGNQTSIFHNMMLHDANTSIANLLSTITVIRRKQKHQGKAHRYLGKICDTLDSHSKLLDMLPNQSIYASILCGGIKTLIGASVNHRKILEALSGDLMEVGNLIQSCVHRATLVNTAEMRTLVQQLYAKVFSFLKGALAWYELKRWKRLLNSFNDNYYGTFSSILNDMKEIANRIKTSADTAHHAETRDTRLLVEELQEQLKFEREENLELWKQKYKQTEEQNEMLLDMKNREMLGNFLSTLLIEDASKVAPKLLMLQASLPGVSQKDMQWLQPRKEVVTDLEAGPERCSGNNTILRSKNQYLKEDFQNDSKTLEDYITPPLDPMDIVSETQIFAEHRIVEAVQTFCRATTSQMLWIIGTKSRRYPSPISSIAASIINALDEASVPTLNVFLDYPVTDSGAIINLQYSLIRQMINLLPTQITTNVDMSPRVFSLLDGTLESWETGMLLIEALFEYMPPLLFLVLDGLDHLDFLSPGEQNLDSLIKLLRKQVLLTIDEGNAKSTHTRTFKVLFTTAGNCATLNALEEKSFTILKTSDNQSAQPGKPRPGRSQITLE
ncbi:hypothetical protein BP6252_02475 [Coleophoma cylindrospora]|uniref:DUF7708 domain-containing protein n=1 Tax=Coleophoma cylindrospora TaxID=1849047 RepID=A0A3D8SEW9_9HELO|nr:hypothetical protein BP6252_02475 [Coleophoma cylindrospora]